MEHIVLIKHGTVHDAVQREAYQADILVKNGKIAGIGPDLEEKDFGEAQVLDAS